VFNRYVELFTMTSSVESCWWFLYEPSVENC